MIFSGLSRCGWEESKSTVHLGDDCMTVSRAFIKDYVLMFCTAQDNHCIEYVHHAIAGERQHPSTIIRHLNLKFNCTGRFMCPHTHTTTHNEAQVFTPCKGQMLVMVVEGLMSA